MGVSSKAVDGAMGGAVRERSGGAIWWLAGGVLAGTVSGVFGLPFLFPPSHPAFSAAYSSGFNNRVAAVATAVMALVTLGASWWRPAGQRRGEQASRMGWRPLLIAMACCAVFTAGLGTLLTRALVAFNDNRYFLQYMDQVLRYGRHVYRDFSFLYGPLLLYFPVACARALRPLGVGLQGSYYVALTLMEVLGLVLLFFTLEALPLRRRVKMITLAVFTVAVLCPLLGLNYTLVRSLLPFATLLMLTRVRRPLVLAALLVPAEMLQLAVSPELGVAFAAGACFYALCRAMTASRWYGVAVLSAPLAAAVFVGLMGREYLHSVTQFSSGCLNLIVEPLLYMLFFLLTVVWVVPRWLGGLLAERAPEAVPMLSLFVLSLALVPAALGRCDPLHVFFNGAGMFLLGAVAVGSYRAGARMAWLAALAGVVLWMQAVNTRVYLRPLGHAVKVNVLGMAEWKNSWFQTFQQVAGRVARGRVALPFYVPYSLEEQLKAAGLDEPDRDVFYIGVWDGPTEAARVARMNATEWAIVSNGERPQTETAESSARLLGLGYRYRTRREPYAYGAIILDELAAHWTVAARNEDWTLYHNPRFGRAVLR